MSDMTTDSTELTMPELKGTPKQIAWALQIRQSFTLQANQAYDLMLRDASAGAKPADVIEAGRAKMMCWMARPVDAAFWIDRRDLSFAGIKRDLATYTV